MRRIIAESQDFVRSEVSIEDAINWAKENNQPYKLELLNDLKNAGTTNAKILAEGDFELGDASSTASASIDRAYVNHKFGERVSVKAGRFDQTIR